MLFMKDETMLNKQICTSYATSEEQVADVFIKAISITRFHILCNKLDMLEYALA